MSFLLQSMVQSGLPDAVAPFGVMIYLRFLSHALADEREHIAAPFPPIDISISLRQPGYCQPLNRSAASTMSASGPQ